MVSIPNLGVGLAGALGLGVPGEQMSSGPPRVPMVFTSTLRQRIAQQLGLLSEGLSVAQTQSLQGLQGLDISNFPSFISPAFQPSITMLVNPNSLKFSQPKRYTKIDTRDGSTFFHWTNRKGQNNDILTINASGNTGILDLRGSLGIGAQNSNSPGDALASGVGQDNGVPDNSGPDTGALAKLLAWQNLYLLTKEPMLLPDNTENVFIINFASKTFPVPFDMFGFFTKALDFEENAKKPNSLDYSWEFVVSATEPDMDDILAVIGDLLITPPVAPAGVSVIPGLGQGSVVGQQIDGVFGPTGVVIV